MQSNLPHGCSINDIPGERPEDIAWECFINYLIDYSNEHCLSVEEMREIWNVGVQHTTAKGQNANDGASAV